MKKLLVIIGSIVVLLVAALVAPFLIPTDTYKTRIIALVKQATGRDLKIDGAVRLSFLPRAARGRGEGCFLRQCAGRQGSVDAPAQGASGADPHPAAQPLHGEVAIGRFVLDAGDLPRNRQERATQLGLCHS